MCVRACVYYLTKTDSVSNKPIEYHFTNYVVALKTPSYHRMISCRGRSERWYHNVQKNLKS